MQSSTTPDLFKLRYKLIYLSPRFARTLNMFSLNQMSMQFDWLYLVYLFLKLIVRAEAC